MSTAILQPEPILLNRRDAARVLSISERVLFDLTQDGTIPHVRLGARGVRYPIDALKARIQELQNGSGK